MVIKFGGSNKEYYFLSNFYNGDYAMFMFRSEVFRTAEHAYQATKSLHLKDRVSYENIKRAPNPLAAKAESYKIEPRSEELVEEWHKIKNDEMLEICRAKFRHPVLKEALLATGDKVLLEDAGSDYWGVGEDGEGQNVLGKILMKIREEIQ